MTPQLNELLTERSIILNGEVIDMDKLNSIEAKIEAECLKDDLTERMERHKAFHEYKTDKEAWESLLEGWTLNQKEALLDDMDNMVELYEKRIVWIKNHLQGM